MVDTADSFSPYVIVRAINSGRADSSLSKIYFTTFKGKATARGASEDTAVPFGLAAGAERRFTFDLNAILNDLDLELDEAENISIVAEFGDKTQHKTCLPPVNDLLKLMGSSMWRTMTKTEVPQTTDSPPE